MARKVVRSAEHSVDPIERMLHYRERHAGWYIFRSIYWGVYLFIVGVLLVLMDSLNYTTSDVVGTAFILLAVMIVVYGFVEALHNKLMKKYG